jgi:TolA-binding protein
VLRATGTKGRGPGRLYIESRLGETLLEIDEAVNVGWPEGGLDVLARADAFDAAVFGVEPTADADILRALVDGVTVNGNAVTEHELAPGDAIEAPRVRARYERAARGALRAATRAADGEPTGAGKARAVTAIAIVGTLAVVGLAVLRIGGIGERSESATRLMRDERDALAAARDAEAGSIVGPGKGASAEAPARAAYEAARAAARRRPGEVERARAALRDVARRYPRTAYGALAAIEAEELGSGAGGASSREIENLIAQAETDTAEGRLDDALRSLRAFAEERLDTIDATIARRAIVRLEAEMDARVAADTTKYRAAITAHDYPLAVRVMDRMLDYVPLAVRDRVLTDKRDVKRRMDAVLGGGGTTSGDARPPEPPPRRPDQPPVRPPDTPVTDDTPDVPDAADRDAEALVAFREARRAMDSGKDRDALSGFVEFLREYKDTPTGAKYDLEVRRRITSLATGPAGVQEIFRGKVEKRERGRFRITYDFEDAEQMLDFRDVNAFEAPPRAQWNVVSGAARAKGSGAYVLDAHFRPEFLSVQVKVQPERAHDLGVIMFEAGEPRRYYLYTLQNSFFKLGKGDGREDFRENAIVLFGPGMWRDSPPDEIGFVRKCGSEEPKFSPGQPAKIKCGKAEDEVWMRFPGGRTVRGSAYGDQKYEFTGIVPGVFLVNSAGFFDELVVEGVPDADWLAQRWRDLLNEL